MNPLRAIAIAFSTYSRIPMPQFSWEEGDSKYALIFLPLVGCVIGLAFILWVELFSSFQPIFIAVGCVLLPLLLTGGIHMDGYLDTCDALASLQSREKRLSILKDVHIGAFAVIKGMMYLLALVGVYSEDALQLSLPLACGFVLSRSVSMVMLAALNNARGEGMLHALQEGAPRRSILQSAALFGFLACLIPLLLFPLPALAGMAAVMLSTVRFQRLALKEFGGITGDLAGYCIQHAELWWAVGLIIAWRFI
jgi:adenosylcobinamide-GDP ribazoletransferase